jgi:gamma-glutamylcyclotransferase (GGCT)/AIG2-like uncharacterized protein YtfP
MAMADINQLFVYGSLRKGFHEQMYDYMSHYFHFVGYARLKGTMYDLGDYPAVIPSDDGHWIIGELYDIKNQDEFEYVIAQLDDYEGCCPEEGEKSLYRRELSEIVLADNNTPTTAWVYWYNGDVSGCPIVESGDVMEYRRSK